MEIAGLSGFEMTGTGSRAGETGYAAVLFTDDGYFVIAGDFDPARHPDQLPAFREMERSFVLSRPAAGSSAAAIIRLTEPVRTGPRSRRRP